MRDDYLDLTTTKNLRIAGSSVSWKPDLMTTVAICSRVACIPYILVPPNRRICWVWTFWTGQKSLLPTRIRIPDGAARSRWQSSSNTLWNQYSFNHAGLCHLDYIQVFMLPMRENWYWWYEITVLHAGLEDDAERLVREHQKCQFTFCLNKQRVINQYCWRQTSGFGSTRVWHIPELSDQTFLASSHLSATTRVCECSHVSYKSSQTYRLVSYFWIIFK
jgi:hypothetical protein